MLTSLEDGFGLDVVIWLQDHGGALLDALAQVMDVMGGSMFILIVGPLIYWSLHKRTGQHMVLLLLFGALAYTAAKQLIDTPRPYVAHPDQVEALFEEEGGGLPSGHVVNTLAFWLPAVIALHVRPQSGPHPRQRWLWWGAFAALVLLMGWSRMYAGVHYPQDVIGGLLIGGVVIALYYRLHVEPETVITPGWLAGLTLLLLALIPFFWSYDDGLMTVGAFLGAIWGLRIETRVLRAKMEGDRIHRALRYLAGVAIMMALFVGMRVLFGSTDPILRVVRYGVTLLYVVAGWPWTCQKIGW